MNPEEIDRLLRESPPDPAPAPGLDTRIRASLQSAPRPSTPRVGRIVGLATAAVVIFNVGIIGWLAVHNNRQPARTAMEPEQTATPAAAPAESGAAATDANPLRAEAHAIGRDASRAGRFLLDCLPSVAER